MRTSLYLLAVVIAVAACGEVKGVKLDAKPLDASVDAVDADLTGMATVVTQTHFPGGTAVGTLVGNIDYVSLLPNGMVHDMGKTDTSGHASVKVYPGGSVTVIYRHTADVGADLVTYMGVKPNDSLTFGQFWMLPYSTTSLGTMTISWPAYTGAAGLNYYYACGPCGCIYAPSTATSITLNELAYCDHEPMNFLGIAFNSSGQVLGMSYSFVNFQNGASAGLNGWQNASTATATFTGLPPEIVTATEYFYLISNGGQTNYAYGISGAPTGGALTESFPWVPTGERTESMAVLSRQGNYQPQRVMDSLNQLTVTIDSPPLPPWVDNQGGVTSSVDRKVTWLQSGPATHSANTVQMAWQHNISGNPVPFTWSFVVPPDVTEFDFPKLPAIFDDTQPKPEDYVNASVRALTIPSASSYDSARQLPEAQLMCPDCAVRLNLLPRVIQSGY